MQSKSEKWDGERAKESHFFEHEIFDILLFIFFDPFCEHLRKALWGVNRYAGDGLAVKSAKMGFVAGEESLAPVLDGGGEHGAVFFRQEQGEAGGWQCGRAREA